MNLPPLHNKQLHPNSWQCISTPLFKGCAPTSNTLDTSNMQKPRKLCINSKKLTSPDVILILEHHDFIPVMTWQLFPIPANTNPLKHQLAHSAHYIGLHYHMNSQLITQFIKSLPLPSFTLYKIISEIYT
jgi:hypothetical protein